MKKNQSSFKFADDKLHESLISAIRKAKIEYKIGADGSILYSDDSIEKFIQNIVDEIFSDSFYRSEIADPVKAFRYRRFKMFRGTPFIEEIRDGKTFFVQKIFEKLYRSHGIPTHIKFILAAKDLDPDKTTSTLGISPTFACRKGDQFTRPYTDAPLRASPVGYWELCSLPLVESNDIDTHLKWLLNILNPIESQLNGLVSESSNKFSRILQISEVRPKGSMQGVSFSSSVLERLSVLCDRVDTWFDYDDFI